MNNEQESMLNGLLRRPKLRYTLSEQEFLVKLATKLRHTILSRTEGRALDLLWRTVFNAYPTVDPGRIDTWEGTDVRPERETPDEGGPGGTRPPGTGDGSDVPDTEARSRRFGETIP